MCGVFAYYETSQHSVQTASKAFATSIKLLGFVLLLILLLQVCECFAHCELAHVHEIVII